MLLSDPSCLLALRDPFRSASDRDRNWLLATRGRVACQGASKRRKARPGDALIAQSCIDQGIALLTRDRDFRAFAEAAGLNLVLGAGA